MGVEENGQKKGTYFVGIEGDEVRISASIPHSVIFPLSVAHQEYPQ